MTVEIVKIDFQDKIIKGKKGNRGVKQLGLKYTSETSLPEPKVESEVPPPPTKWPTFIEKSLPPGDR